MRKSNILAEIVIPDYLEYIQLAKERRVKYYMKGKVIPKRYSDKTKYTFNSKGILVKIEDDEKVIANPRSVGTPRMKKISGQDIWNGALNPHMRARIAKDLKRYFREFYGDLGKVAVEDYPIGVKLDFHKPIGVGNWDIDNHSLIYRKVIMDSLKGFIEDDSVKYVRSIPCNYYDCPEEEKKIVITIFKLT